MIVFPKNQLCASGLNSYYLNIARFIEHVQGEIETGCILFKAPETECVVYFDERILLNCIFISKNDLFAGKEAFILFLREAKRRNFTVTTYKIDPEYLYFCACLDEAETVYTDLSSEFTSLEDLVYKFKSKKLTGYITAVHVNNNKSGNVFFVGGSVIGTHFHHKGGGLDISDKRLSEMVKMCERPDVFFNVKKMSLAKDDRQFHIEDFKNADERFLNDTGNFSSQIPARTISMMTELLKICENSVRSNKRIKKDFEIIFRINCLEKIESYPFLDPFGDEFTYIDGRIILDGNFSESAFTAGVTDVVKNISIQAGTEDLLQKKITAWRLKYHNEISRLKINL